MMTVDRGKALVFEWRSARIATAVVNTFLRLALRVEVDQNDSHHLLQTNPSSSSLQLPRLSVAIIYPVCIIAHL